MKEEAIMAAFAISVLVAGCTTFGLPHHVAATATTANAGAATVNVAATLGTVVLRYAYPFAAVRNAAVHNADVCNA